MNGKERAIKEQAIAATLMATGILFCGCRSAFKPVGGKPAFQGTVIDAVEVADMPRPVPKPRKRTVTDVDEIRRIVSCLKPQHVDPSAGESRWTIRLMAKGKLLKEIWVYDYGEWGYDGKTRGSSGALPGVLASILKATPAATRVKPK